MDELFKKIDREMRSGIYTLLILRAIADLGESYGYEMEKHLYERSHGKINLKDATVYPTLRYLTKKKALQAYWTEPGAGVPRKYYRLTNSGKKLLKELTEDYLDLSNCVIKILRGEK